MKKAVFLDRDGTLVEDLDFLTDLADLKLLPTVPEAIQRLNRAGYLCVVITNQSGVARGFLSEKTLKQMHEKLSEMLAAQGAKIDAYYYCPHHPSVGQPEYRKDCDCRKPKSGMFLSAAKDLDIDLSQSFGIGDKARDAQAAKGAGVRALLVTTGPEADEAQVDKNLHLGSFANLNAAVDFILNS